MTRECMEAARRRPARPLCGEATVRRERRQTASTLVCAIGRLLQARSRRYSAGRRVTPPGRLRPGVPPRRGAVQRGLGMPQSAPLLPVEVPHLMGRFRLQRRQSHSFLVRSVELAGHTVQSRQPGDEVGRAGSMSRGLNDASDNVSASLSRASSSRGTTFPGRSP